MNKIPVSILGATGAVGQRFVEMLVQHPYFEIVSLTGSERSAGKAYGEACRWVLSGSIPEQVQHLKIQPTSTHLPGQVAFSALPAAIAREWEPQLAAVGYAVCSNASALRQTPGVPLLIPEINYDHLDMIPLQQSELGWKGLAVTSPNCTTNGIAMTLKPLDDAFGVEAVFVSTMQAISGAGYPGLASLDIQDNVIPFINGEEEKIQTETNLLLGKMLAGRRVNAQIQVSAHANRVPVLDGHTIALSIKFRSKPSVEDAMQVLEDFRGPAEVQQMPTAPERPILVRRDPDRPQPRRDRDAGNGMSVSVGRIRPCNLFDLRMVTVVHNTVRGAAGGSVLNAELLYAKGLLSA
ncbi:MAG: aspartate-semialdehyde dehydrogenase [Anaerolineaceae bacterium]|jgi:aspartate-semialdehyde dehydrogenase|nr:aspartate-semialdehyde dehydrogenase [Anaerolineaceae bacterium]